MGILWRFVGWRPHQNGHAKAGINADVHGICLNIPMLADSGEFYVLT